MLFKATVGLVVAFTGLAIHACGAAITVPPGLNPGDTYRILFVTSTARGATSANIADYNTFVTDAAGLDANLALLGTTWFALASTATDNALTNAGLSLSDTTTPFYNTRGQRIAVGTVVARTGLYGGLSTVHLNPLFTEAGDAPPVYAGVGPIAYTGTMPDGTTSPNRPVGGTNGVVFGDPSSAAYFWTQIGTVGGPAVSNPYSFYGISAPLTVPGATIPEPGSITMAGLGAAALLLLHRVRRTASNHRRL